MNFLHYEFDLDVNDVVEVTLDRRANVCLLDDANFAKYKRRERYTYYGGNAKQSPVRLTPPQSGHWHLIIDLGGFPGTVRASVNVLRTQHA